MKVNAMFEAHSAYYVIGSALFMLAQSAIIVMLLAQRRRNRQIKRALRASEAKYRLLAENVTDVIWTVDGQLHLTYISPSIEKLSGWTPQERLAQDFRMFLTPQARDAAQNAFDHEVRLTRQAGYDWRRTVVFEAEHYRKDGSSFYAEISGRLLCSAQGEFTGAIGITRDITARKHAQASLREWAQRYDLIVAASGQVAYDYDVLTGAIIWGNTIESVLGYPLTEISQGFQQWVDLLHPEDREKTLNILSKAEAACSFWDAEYRMRHKDGRYVWVRDRGFFLPDAAGKAVRQLGMLEEISERKRDEETLRESEERLRAFIEQTSEGVAIIDEDGRVVEWNPANEQMSGFSRADVLGQYYWDVMIRSTLRERRTPERRAQFERKIRDALRTGQPVFTGPVEIEYECVDGERRFSQQVVFAIKTERGYCFGSLSHDITERKRTEEELRQYREQLEKLVEIRTAELQREIEAHKRAEQSLQENEANVTALIENTDSMIWSIDRNYRLIVGNTVFHATRREALGTDYVKGEMVIPETAPQAFRELWYGYYDRVLAGERFICEERLQHPFHKDEWWEFRLSPIQSVGGDILGGTALGRNITARKQVEEELRLLNQQIGEANQRLQEANASKDTFFSILAHDLRNPFMVLLGLTEVLNEEFERYPKVQLQETLQRLHDSSKSIYALLTNLLEWSRLERGILILEPRTFLMTDIVLRNIRLFAAQARRKQIQVQQQVPDGMAVYADFKMIDTVMRNLLSNALKFTGSGGVVAISGRTDARDVELIIADTGVGMDPEMLSKLFRIDQKTSRQGTDGEKGTGLGLILCKELVEKNGGVLQVESVEGEGTTFRLRLPMFPQTPS